MKMTSLSDPFFLTHRALRVEVARMAKQAAGTVVDVGCGMAPYRELFSHTKYIGIETRDASRAGSGKAGADLLYDGVHLPLANESVDNVLCNQVLSIYSSPWRFYPNCIASSVQAEDSCSLSHLHGMSMSNRMTTHDTLRSACAILRKHVALKW